MAAFALTEVASELEIDPQNGIEREDEDPANDTYKTYYAEGPSTHDPFLPDVEEWYEPAACTHRGPLHVASRYSVYDSVEAATARFREKFSIGPDSRWRLVTRDDSSRHLQVNSRDDGVVADSISAGDFRDDYVWEDQGYYGTIGRTILSGNAVLSIGWKPD